MKALTSEQLYKLYQEKKEEETTKKGNKFLTCGNCKCKTTINKFYRVEKYWFDNCPYTPNYYPSDELCLICPKCNVLNRFLDKDTAVYNKVRNYNGEYAKEYKFYGEYGNNEYTSKGKKCDAPYTHYVNV